MNSFNHSILVIYSGLKSALTVFLKTVYYNNNNIQTERVLYETSSLVSAFKLKYWYKDRKYELHCKPILDPHYALVPANLAFYFMRYFYIYRPLYRLLNNHYTAHNNTKVKNIAIWGSHDCIDIDYFNERLGPLSDQHTFLTRYQVSDGGLVMGYTLRPLTSVDLLGYSVNDTKNMFIGDINFYQHSLILNETTLHVPSWKSEITFI
uniref:Uncharacterized protein n=1 Tax=viral metagenome TaxID=1070528 RepID=A0A6C0CRE6_9ZZZZ